MNPRCPRCDITLTKEGLDKTYPGKTDSKTEIEVCHKCGGIWFDYGELQVVDNIVDPTYWEFREIPESSKQKVALRCPKCQDLVMNKSENSRDKNVIMDVCPNCKGVWLDKGELTAIQQENVYGLLFNAFKWLFKK